MANTLGLRGYNSVPALGRGAPSRHPQGGEMDATGVFPFVRACQYAELQGIGVHALYRMLRSRKIPHYKLRGTYWVDPDEIEAWLESRRINSVAEQIDLF